MVYRTTNDLIEMDPQQRKIMALEPIVWTGDRSDDCTAVWAGLMLRAELMDENLWWWRVYDEQRDDSIVDDSNEHPENFTSGTAAWEKAEAVAKTYIAGVIRTKATTIILNDVFKITGRGLVLTGHLEEVVINSGDVIDFTAFGYIFQRKIICIDFPRTSLLLDKPLVGLLIKCKDEFEIENLRKWNFDNQPAVIFKSDSTHAEA